MSSTEDSMPAHSALSGVRALVASSAPELVITLARCAAVRRALDRLEVALDSAPAGIATSQPVRLLDEVATCTEGMTEELDRLARKVAGL
jgi:hypothetical protein